LWERVESELLAALALSDLDATASRQAQHFIDHNELGLSFEVIVESLLKREARPSQAVYQHLERAANEMELTASDVWLRFAKPSYE